jgi:hypothetical protein
MSTTDGCRHAWNIFVLFPPLIAPISDSPGPTMSDTSVKVGVCIAFAGSLIVGEWDSTSGMGFGSLDLIRMVSSL